MMLAGLLNGLVVSAALWLWQRYVRGVDRRQEEGKEDRDALSTRIREVESDALKRHADLQKDLEEKYVRYRELDDIRRDLRQIRSMLADFFSFPSSSE
jgi:C4-dicarboxylate-specific signal transduction histidine kinase